MASAGFAASVGVAVATAAAARAFQGMVFAIAPGGNRPGTLRGSPVARAAEAGVRSSDVYNSSSVGAAAVAASIGALAAVRRAPRHLKARSSTVREESVAQAQPFAGASLPLATVVVDSVSSPSTVARRGQMQPSVPDAGIAIIDKEKTDKKAAMKEQFDKEKWWRVLLHNDDIHTFEYVTGCLTRTCKHLSRRKAYNITWEAHSSGMATVSCVWKSLAEQQCVNLQQLGLTVSIAPDSKFSGNKGGE